MVMYEFFDVDLTLQILGTALVVVDVDGAGGHQV